MNCHVRTLNVISLEYRHSGVTIVDKFLSILHFFTCINLSNYETDVIL